jgi:CRISPR/Cas system-associated exonuclease Cas4 (RecB family)
LNDVDVRGEDLAEKLLQCLIYYMGLPDQFKECTEDASIYILDTGKEISTQITHSLVEKACNIVEGSLKLAAGFDFPAKLNPFCSSCGYQSLCAAYSRPRNNE